MIKKFAKKCFDYTVEHIKYIVHTTLHKDEHGKELVALTMAFALLLSAVMYDPCITASARAAETNIENKPYVIMAGEKELAVAGSKAEADMVVDKVMAKYGVTTSAEKAICDPALTVEPKTTVLAERTPQPLQVEDAVNSILYQNSGKNPHFKVVVTNEMIKTEVKEYKVKVVKTSSMLKGTTKVAQEGRDGKYVVKGKTTMINGKVISETVYEKDLIKKPVTKIIKVGTKPKKIKGVATGDMMMPTYGSIVSGYGYRIGPVYGYEFHMGIDITASYGQSIMAADGGRVVLASYHPSYGNQIVIDHGNGLQTRYAHCSSLEVSVGDAVMKGERIAGAGSTGASTGVHLHFEVLKGGSHTNPMSYI